MRSPPVLCDYFTDANVTLTLSIPLLLPSLASISSLSLYLSFSIFHISSFPPSLQPPPPRPYSPPPAPAPLTPHPTGSVL